MARVLLYKSYELASDVAPTWGGARNRADRVSRYLSQRQVNELIEAVVFSAVIGLPLNRHWTVHTQRAGFADVEGAAFIGRLLTQARRYTRTRGARMAALWVRENGPLEGSHVHIMLHIPCEWSLRNLTCRWIRQAGGKSVRGVSRVRTIAGRLDAEAHDPELYWANVRRLVAYLLKGAEAEVGVDLGLPRAGQVGAVVGKRCGWTQNIGRAARSKSSLCHERDSTVRPPADAAIFCDANVEAHRASHGLRLRA
jgi:hypothetical protein